MLPTHIGNLYSPYSVTMSVRSVWKYPPTEHIHVLELSAVLLLLVFLSLTEQFQVHHPLSLDWRRADPEKQRRITVGRMNEAAAA